MKGSAVVMLVLVLGLGALAYTRGGTALVLDGVRASRRGLGQLLAVLAVMVLLAGFVEVLLPKDVVARWLSDAAGARGLALAWVAGVLTPGGGPIGLPIAAALMRQGAGWGVLVTYVTSMSLLSFVRVPLELGIYGSRLTVMRMVSSLILPFLAGLTAQFLARVLGPG